MASHRICSIEDCGKPAYSRNLCEKHRARYRRYGDPLWQAPPQAKKICLISGCAKSATQRGWCGAHYARWRAHGHPLAGRTPNGEPRSYFETVVLNFEGNDCLIWPYGKYSTGYASMYQGGAMKPVHRLVCEAFNGPPPTKQHEAAHSCGKGHKGCVNPRHLSWKTCSENHADKLRHGTHNRGERSPRAKLTPSQVLEIRALQSTMSKCKLARLFGVSAAAVDDICRNRSWRDL
jgi:hypothetical protein